MDHLDGPSIIAKVLIKRRQEAHREVGGVRTKAEVGWNDAPANQGKRAVSRSWKRPGKAFSPEASRRNHPC